MLLLQPALDGLNSHQMDLLLLLRNAAEKKPLCLAFCSLSVKMMCNLSSVCAPILKDQLGAHTPEASGPSMKQRDEFF